MSDPCPPLFLTDFRDPAGCFERVADALIRGASTADHPFHHFTLSTVDDDGTPDARTVVLRGFDPDVRLIRVFTDARSPKTEQLQSHSRASLVFYDPNTRLQVRTVAETRVHREDEMAAAAWGSSPEESRAFYASTDGPGVEIDVNAAFAVPPPPALDDTEAFSRFVVVVCRFDWLDVLELHHAGHRRGRFTWRGNEVKLTRLTP